MSMPRQELLAWGITSPPAGSGYIAAPGSGATITLWQSPGSSGVLSPHGQNYKRVMVGVYSSHASAASGLQFDVSVDGTNWRNLVSYSVAATTLTINYVSTVAPHLRVRYVNSANVLTTWEIWVMGDEYERATQ